jgi:hypothetical protein
MTTLTLLVIVEVGSATNKINTTLTTSSSRRCRGSSLYNAGKKIHDDKLSSSSLWFQKLTRQQKTTMTTSWWFQKLTRWQETTVTTIWGRRHCGVGFVALEKKTSTTTSSGSSWWSLRTLTWREKNMTTRSWAFPRHGVRICNKQKKYHADDEPELVIVVVLISATLEKKIHDDDELNSLTSWPALCSVGKKTCTTTSSGSSSWWL